jgi:GDPmannose 4,6-dehydratase|tara:strand:- start:16257 stop:17297 length:1041 start_codon:yes stop_codon:yes gene_type:complete
MKKKIALITGITGQDGAYLAKFLIKKNYIVHGIKRRASTINNYRIDDIYEKYYLSSKSPSFFLHYGDVTDSLNLSNLVHSIQPDEVYNLAAQSHVKVSFETPEYTANADGLGVLRLLEIIKKEKKQIKFYQASTSEMFGGSKPPQNENTPFHPKSPYGVAKLFGYWMTRVYRESYNMHASNGILFNHESPLRGETFVTKKIVNSVAKTFLGIDNQLLLGNLNATRDWGHARDYVKSMWLILQRKIPDDFVICTEKSYSVREFVNAAYKNIGIEVLWKGKGLNEKGINKENKKVLIKISPAYFRPNEVENLRGKNTKAKNILKWKNTTTFSDLVKEMLNHEIEILKK